MKTYYCKYNNETYIIYGYVNGNWTYIQECIQDFKNKTGKEDKDLFFEVASRNSSRFAGMGIVWAKGKLIPEAFVFKDITVWKYIQENVWRNNT